MKISSRIAISLALIALINTIVLNILFRDQLRIQGLHFIRSYQQNQRSSFLVVVQNLISLFGNQILYALLGFVYIAFYHKMCAYVFFYYMIFHAYMIGLTKQMFQDPRPFSQDSQIQSLDWTCHTSYGMPSGHTWMCILIYEPVISDLIGTKGPKKLLLVWLLLTGSLISVARQYLGTHTSDQVMFGLVFSLAFLILYKFLLRERIFRFMTLGYRPGLLCFFNTLGFLAIFILPFTFYEVNMRYRRFPQEKIDLLNLACGKEVTFKDLQIKAGIQSSVLGIAFGMVCGFIISGLQCFKIKYYQKTSSDGRIVINQFHYFLIGRWNFRGSFLNVIKFLLIQGFFGGTFGFLIANVAAAKIDQFQVRYIVQALAYAIFGIAITSFIPALCFKWQAFEIEPLSESETNIGTNQGLNKQGLNIQIATRIPESLLDSPNFRLNS